MFASVPDRQKCAIVDILLEFAISPLEEIIWQYRKENRRAFNPDYNWQNNQNMIEMEDSNSIDTNLYLLEQLILIQQD